tara:strand:- start:18345 stop:18722 length:378 start_codon:yes stop_codon:yes gene_type:complete
MTEAAKPLVSAYLQQAKVRHEGHLTKVDVVEFGEDGDPVAVFAKKPTIADRSAILRQSFESAGRDDQFEQAIRTVIRLACDETGEKLFTLEHAQFLRTNVDGDVIQALAYRLDSGLSFDAAKKNS